MKRILLTFESGKNNIAGCSTHIMRGSHIIMLGATELLTEEVVAQASIDVRLSHYGHTPDWCCLIDAKELPNGI